MKRGRVLDSSDEAYQQKSYIFFSVQKKIIMLKLSARQKRNIQHASHQESQRINDDHDDNDDDKQIFIKKKKKKKKSWKALLLVSAFDSTWWKQDDYFKTILFTFVWVDRIQTCIIFFCGSFNTNIVYVLNMKWMAYTMALEFGSGFKISCLDTNMMMTWNKRGNTHKKKRYTKRINKRKKLVWLTFPWIIWFNVISNWMDTGYT